MVGGRERGHSHAQLDGGNFCSIQEVGAQETDGDKRVVQVDEATRRNLSASVALWKRSADRECDHAGGHANTADDEDGATAIPINAHEPKK